jgi:hypothetical protein
LHGAGLDPHRHREAPPDQQEAGSILKVDVGGAACGCGAGCACGAGCGGGEASTSFGLGRQSEEAFAASASQGARGTLAGGLASLSMRRAGGGDSVGGGGNEFLAASGRLARGIGGGSPMSAFSR